MNKEISEIFESCMQALQKGESLDYCLDPDSEMGAVLSPLIRSAQDLGELIRVDLHPEDLKRHRIEILDQASKIRFNNSPRRLLIPFYQKVILVSIVTIALIFGTRNLLIVSASSLPGEPLYSIKRTVENTQLKFTADPDQKNLLVHEFRQRRLDETEELLTEGIETQVEFDGTINSKLPYGWMVDNIPVVITADTEVYFVIRVGNFVEIVGRTQPEGSVIAERILLEDQESELEGEFPWENLNSSQLIVNGNPVYIETANPCGNNSGNNKDCHPEDGSENNFDDQSGDGEDFDHSERD
jgi:hypothetical protein